MNSFILKIIAIISMLFSHVGFILYDKDMVMFQLIGRIAFPIFCYFIVIGFYHTKDVKRYLLRLGLFALLSEPFFDFGLRGAFYFSQSQNVMFTLALGLLAIYIFHRFKEQPQPVLGYIYVISIALIADLFGTDYGSYGIITIFIFYKFYKDKWGTFISIFILNLIRLLIVYTNYGISFYNSIQFFSILALVFIFLYNEKRGPKLKYFFYIFYPLHLLILQLINLYLLK